MQTSEKFAGKIYIMRFFSKVCMISQNAFNIQSYRLGSTIENASNLRHIISKFTMLVFLCVLLENYLKNLKLIMNRVIKHICKGYKTICKCNNITIIIRPVPSLKVIFIDIKQDMYHPMRSPSPILQNYELWH